MLILVVQNFPPEIDLLILPSINSPPKSDCYFFPAPILKPQNYHANRRKGTSRNRITLGLATIRVHRRCPERA